MKKKTEETPELRSVSKAISFDQVAQKVVFNYLKENLTIDVDCSENWGYYENGEVSVTVNLYLKNPETGNNELVCSATGNA